MAIRTVSFPVHSALAPVPTIGSPFAALGAHLGGNLHFVRSAGACKEFPDAYATMTAALAAAKSGDTIVLLSDLREEVTGSNLLFDITIIGAATQPRHDDKHNFTSTFQIGSSSWRNSSGVTTTPLCIVRGQGWRFINILFDAPTTASCVKLGSSKAMRTPAKTSTTDHMRSSSAAGSTEARRGFWSTAAPTTASWSGASSGA
jgi:hypothetical protein